MTSLKTIFSDFPLSFSPLAIPDIPITGIAIDNRKVEPGNLFVALKGSSADGHDFIPDAVRRGAAAVVGDREIAPMDVPYLRVENSRQALTHLAAAFYGSQSRVMDGVLARANCLLISTLWTAFKFVMVPIGAGLATVFAPAQFALVFALIWGSYIVADGLAEVGGSIFGRQTLRVWGIGDVNRKSIGGTVSGFAGSLVFCSWIVTASGLGAPWLTLGFVISVSNTLLELFSPRGTDDFFMATGNALLCLAFGAFVL